MRRFCIPLLFLLLLHGCIGEAQKDCKTDKECLKAAFAKCEERNGTWEGQNGNIGVQIIGKKDNKCGVIVTIASDGLDISNKTMTCYLPFGGNESNFSISNDCAGALVGFFPEPTPIRPPT